MNRGCNPGSDPMITTRPAVPHACLTILMGLAAAVLAGCAPMASPPTSTVAASTPTAAAAASPSASSAGTSQRSAVVGPFDASPPSEGGCSASQFVLGTPTNAPGFGTIGTTSDYVLQPFRNVGGNCVLHLPATIKVASPTSPFQTVKVVNAGTATTFSVQADQSLSIVLGAWWYVPAWLAGTGMSPPPCTGAISNVTRAEIPLESSSLEIDLGTVWDEVCWSPATVSFTVER
jgi:hypothetical protein